MERKIIETRPDGTEIVTIEKSGVVFRDAVIGIVGGLAGLAMGGVTVPVVSAVLPEAITSSKVATYAAVGLTSFTVGEVTEHSVRRALTDVAEFTDGVQEEVLKRKASKMAEEMAEEVSSNEKKTSAKTVREAKK
jgi:hypothetical protein